MLALVHAEFPFSVWIPGARICPFQGVKLKADLDADAGSRQAPFLGLDSRGQNLYFSRGEAKGHIAPRKPLYIVRDPRPHHRHTPPEGGGCWQCARESRRYKRGFLQKPARQPPLGSGGWVPSSLADTPSPKAQCVGEAPGGELLASPRDLGSGKAAPEVAKAPQGAPRGGGSPSRPSPQRGRFAQAIRGWCVV